MDPLGLADGTDDKVPFFKRWTNNRIKTEKDNFSKLSTEPID